SRRSAQERLRGAVLEDGERFLEGRAELGDGSGRHAIGEDGAEDERPGLGALEAQAEEAVVEVAEGEREVARAVEDLDGAAEGGAASGGDVEGIALGRRAAGPDAVAVEA